MMKRYQIILTLFLTIFFSFIFVDNAKAFIEALDKSRNLAISRFDESLTFLPDAWAIPVEELILRCNESLILASAIPCEPVPLVGFECHARTTALAEAEKQCTDAATQVGAEKQMKQMIRDQKRREWWEAIKEEATKAMAGAFKVSLSTFSRQLAEDTATWVASGGKGQKPLFITEGWGAYLENAADSALGDFIDQVGQSYGVDLCRPNLSMRLAIQTSINYKVPRQVRCTFSTMMTNWNSAIQRADFSFEYNNSLQPGENDISTFLLIQGKSYEYVNKKVKEAEDEAAKAAKFKDLKDFAGKVLTPGTTVREALHKALVDPDNVGKKDNIYTGTIFDFVETFLNTLAAQLLNNFKNGLFKGSSDSSSGGSSGFALPNLSALLNPLASPQSEGATGAKERFSELKNYSFKEGGSYDILTKLALCSDSTRKNPGPTDCVIDQKLLSAIKEKKQLYEVLSDTLGIGERLFAPAVGNDNLDSELPLRSIIILRKYRIIPVGWEFAAIKANGSDRNYTLKEVAAGFENPDSIFYGLVNPYWTLKVPELFCRRQGYGGYNTTRDSPDGSIMRGEYCADEQQCLQQDIDNNCQAYGYCTEERRIWTFPTACEPRFNTCQTFSASDGKKQSYLMNTLDFGNCNSTNVGCRWYSMLLDTVNNVWRHLAPNVITRITSTSQTLTLEGKVVYKWHQISTDGMLRMSQPCTQSACDSTSSTNCTYNIIDGTCRFSSFGTPQVSCTSTPGSSGCYLELCIDNNDLLRTFNGGFEQKDEYDWIPAIWNFDNANYDMYNRFYRVAGEGRGTSSALRIIGNNAPVIAEDANTWVSLENIPLEKDKNYQLNFFVRGNYLSGSTGVLDNNGAIIVSIIRGEEKEEYQLYSFSAGWNEKIWYFNSGNFNTTTIKIRLKAGTTADVYFDDFTIKKIKDDCGANSIWLGNASNTASINATENEIYLTKNAPTCNSVSDGCSQFIRLKSGLGSNLVPNGGFEDGAGDGVDVWKKDSEHGRHVEFSRSNSIKNSGSHSLGIRCTLSADSCNADYAVVEVPRAENIINLKRGSKYALSGWVYIASSTVSNLGGGSVELFLLSPNNKIMSAGFDKSRINQWQKVQAVAVMAKDYRANEYDIRVISGLAETMVYFDDIKLEEINYNSELPSSFTEYNPSKRPAEQLTFLRKAPDYLNCYKKGNIWANSSNLYDILLNQNKLCSKYASVCTSDEVGCNIYKPVNGDPEVPGVAESIDLCPAECAGYQVYKQEKTYFVSSTFVQFIANNVPKYCSAAYAGCDEFTNLDELGRGAEQREYFVRIKACQKPSTDDGTYYTWEGEDTTGYQLKVYKLKRSNKDPSAPCTNISYNTSGIGICNDPDAVSHNLENGLCTKENMASNPDCRQFYDAGGNITYRLLSMTVTISDNCHPYRRTQTEKTLTEAEANCTKGWWNSATNECIYMAMKGEGIMCSASVSGCRAYTGNYGNNIRNVFPISQFSNENLEGWIGAVTSSEATYQGGYSIKNTGGQIKKEVAVHKNRTYMLSFWAKASSTGNFRFESIKFNSSTNPNDYFAVSSLKNDGDINLSMPEITGEWKYFEVGPVFVTWDQPEVENLVFNIGSEKVFLDNIQLKEMRDKVYLVENSWFTPFSCDNDLNDPAGKVNYAQSQTNSSAAYQICYDQNPGTDNHRCVPGNMLGCKAYKTQDGLSAYLKSFANLCRKEAAGCEELIDTHNYDKYQGFIFNPDNSKGYNDQITVRPYEKAYLVNSPAYSCGLQDKGCMALGLPKINQYDEVLGYSTVFLKNDPDRYATDLCAADEVWCEQFAGNNSLYYFKNPRKLCEFRGAGDLAAGWYKKGTDEACMITPDQTFGTGYESVRNKYQPIGPINNLTGSSTIFVINNYSNIKYNGWVGLCQDNKNGCSEYIDPITEIYPNLNYKSSSTLVIESNYLYSSSGGFVTTTAASAFCNIYHPLGNVTTTFYVKAKDDNVKTCKINLSSTSTVVTRAGVYYALSTNVNRSGCNGLVDYKTGCVLFNERSSINYSYDSDSNDELIKERNKYLIFNSSKTYSDYIGNKQQPLKASTDEPKDTSVLLKVLPDRTCKNWLYCTTYKKDSDSTTSTAADFRFQSQDSCLRVGLCEKMDYDDRTCDSFTQKNNEPITTNSSNFQFLTGYSVPNYLSFAEMTQEGQSASVSNGNFESTVSASAEPLGWTMSASSSDLDASGWGPDKYAIERNYLYRKQDAGYLRLHGPNELESEPIDVEKGQEYYLSAWLNTLDLLSTTSAEIWVFEGSECSNQRPGRVISMREGINWTKKTLKFTPSTSTICLKLINFNNSLDQKECNDLLDDKKYNINYGTACRISGSSLFDDISLKPVLNPVPKVSQLNAFTGLTDILTKEESTISRSCRIYPDQNAMSCQYSEDGRFYYGWYGYCLAWDPKNPQVCLQWWPVDEIKGDIVDEYSGGYRERSPLYYCVSTTKETIRVYVETTKVTSGGMGQMLNNLAPGLNLNVLGGETAQYSVFESENSDLINASALFRYPFISKPETNALNKLSTLFSEVLSGFTLGGKPQNRNTFHYAGIVLGVGGNLDGFGLGGGIANVHMGRNNVSHFGADGQDPLGIIFDLLGLNNLENTICSSFLKFLLGDKCETYNGGELEPRIGNLTDNSRWGGWGLAATSWFGGDGAGTALLFPESWDNVENKIMSGGSGDGGGDLIGQIMSMAGLDAGGTGTSLGAKVVTDQDPKYASYFTDPNPSVPGDILGLAWNVKAGGIVLGLLMTGSAYSEFDIHYCNKIVQVATPSGKNKAWVDRLSSGSQFAFSTTTDKYPQFTNPYCLKGLNDGVTAACTNSAINGSTTCREKGNTWDEITGKCYYENMIYSNLGYKFDGYGADYKPFGSLVAPSNNFQNPILWDSRRTDDDYTKQPILWETPNFKTEAPYQPRTGQPVKEEALKNLFAQSYGVWVWKEDNNRWDQGSYDEVKGANWSLPNEYCSGLNPGDRDVNWRFINTALGVPCKIKPLITNIKVSTSSQTLRLSFNVKVDKDQLPLTSYTINWGDGSEDSVAGVKLRQRIDENNPFVMYHYYNPNEMSPNPATITITVKDNWNASASSTISSSLIEAGY